MIIELTQGFVTEVDDADKDLSAYNWYYSHGYAVRNTVISEFEYPKDMRLHRVILERKLGRSITECKETDHKDRNKLNNCRYNLREVTSIINHRNSSIQSNNTSGFRGVTKNHQRWIAQIVINKERIYLGNYSTKEKAFEARKSGELKYWGEYYSRIEKLL